MTAASAPGGIGAAPLIRFEGVGKRFGSVRAVDEVTLDIASGEFFCLLGPSGCGKSTLLRLLAGFEIPERGRILLDGRDIAHDPPHRRPLNMMFQSYALFPHLTVGKNVAYGLRWPKLPRAEIAERVAEMLRLVRLEGFGDRYPAQMSGGQRQRAALARALARRPRVLLLDEPLGALDRRLREETGAELKALQTRLGTTFVMVTHDQAEAMSLADRIAVMQAGRLAQVGPPREVYRRPADRFVATFLGDVNILEGSVVGHGQGAVEVALGEGGMRLGVPTHGAPPPPVGQPAAIAIRPEDIALLPPAERPASGALAGEIVGQHYLGASTTYLVRLPGGQVLRVTRAGPGPEPARGGLVALAIPPEGLVLLGAGASA